MPLGLMPDMSYDEGEMTLAPGDTSSFIATDWLRHTTISAICSAFPACKCWWGTTQAERH